MKAAKTFLCVGVLLALALCVPAVQAQEREPRVSSPVAPLPPVSGNESSSLNAVKTGEAAPVPTPRQEQTPLTSAEVWSPAGSGAGRNFLLPSLSLYGGGDTRPEGNQGSSDELSAATTVGGQFAFQHVWARNEFLAEYRGGGTFYSAAPDRNRVYQDFQFAHKTFGRTWTFLLADTISYSPEGGGGGGLGFGQLGIGPGSVSGNPLINLNSQFLPNQSITSTDVPRVSNTILGEFQKTLGRRSALTFSGSYGVLRFLEDGAIDGNTISFRTGYNYSPTARDTIGLLYGGSLFQFLDTDRENLTHTAQVSYGRRITGRLSFQVAAGPQVTLVDTVLGTRESLVSWSADTSLRYHLTRADVRLAYTHGVTGGSGVFLGSRTDHVSVTVSRQLSRLWRGSVNFGFAHNQSLQEIALGTSGRNYNNWQGGFELSRPLGRNTRMYFRYGVQRQTSTDSCTGAGCPLFGTRHMFGLGFNFRFRAIELE